MNRKAGLMHRHLEADSGEEAIWVEVHVGGKGKCGGWEMDKEVLTARVSTPES